MFSLVTQRPVSTWSTVPQGGHLRDRLSVCSSALLSLAGLPCRCVSGATPLRFRVWLCGLNNCWTPFYGLTRAVSAACLLSLLTGRLGSVQLTERSLCMSSAQIFVCVTVGCEFSAPTLVAARAQEYADGPTQDGARKHVADTSHADTVHSRRKLLTLSWTAH